MDQDPIETRGIADVVPFVTVAPGPWEPGREPPFERARALLLVDGLVLSDLRLDRGGATEIQGPGDLLYPWRSPDELLPFSHRHTVVETARVAVLDDGLPELLRRWPDVGARLVAQSAVRHQRQVQHRAASQLPRVEDRILALLWLLAERWGRVGAGGVVLPLALTHELLGRLVGARRPTVTMAMGQLVDDGHLRRRADRGVVLTLGSRSHLLPHGVKPGSKVEDLQQLALGAPAPAPAPTAEGAHDPPASKPRRTLSPLVLESLAQRQLAEQIARDGQDVHRRARQALRHSVAILERSGRRRAGASPPPVVD